MARKSIKNLSIDQRIQLLEQKITETKENLKDLDRELKELNEQKKNEEMAGLWLTINNKGLSIEEAIEKINS